MQKVHRRGCVSIIDVRPVIAPSIETPTVGHYRTIIVDVQGSAILVGVGV